MLINQLVNTPIGEGRLQGPFTPSPYPLPTPAKDDQSSHLSPGQAGEGNTAVLVRLPINEQTRDHLKQSNCMTPRATQSGLWVFELMELK